MCWTRARFPNTSLHRYNLPTPIPSRKARAPIAAYRTHLRPFSPLLKIGIVPLKERIDIRCEFLWASHRRGREGRSPPVADQTACRSSDGARRWRRCRNARADRNGRKRWNRRSPPRRESARRWEYPHPSARPDIRCHQRFRGGGAPCGRCAGCCPDSKAVEFFRPSHCGSSPGCTLPG